MKKISYLSKKIKFKIAIITQKSILCGLTSIIDYYVKGRIDKITVKNE